MGGELPQEPAFILGQRLSNHVMDEPAPDGGTWQKVYRLRDGEGGRDVEIVRALIDMSDGVHTEILGGLKAGDVLATGIDLTARTEERHQSRLFGPEPAQF